MIGGLTKASWASSLLDAWPVTRRRETEARCGISRPVAQSLPPTGRVDPVDTASTSESELHYQTGFGSVCDLKCFIPKSLRRHFLGSPFVVRRASSI
ncbi:hypothetical protein PoB_000304700 [Plakobranchus ocellatus]|uniref:Uncharacterized protein n=1 Tax=Plakobranchus ocellatus TaxID=259542 RepID=A0AAV3Y292_9GAST|nr:hypothetical protein PoB_000304700 [Plakobranchus ocellatus]